MNCDAFLSYNSDDRAVVEEFGRKLQARGLSCFLDHWHVRDGMRWRPTLEDSLAKAKAFVTFIGPSGMGHWQTREIDLAMRRQENDEGFPVIPLLLPGCEPPVGFLSLNRWIDQRACSIEQVLSQLERSIRRESLDSDIADQAAVKNSICPYRALMPFREEDARFFFGREKVTKQLVQIVEESCFVGLVGASGSGKSSVVLAGLVPRLRSDAASDWEIVTMVPGDDPIKSLASALIPLIYSDGYEKGKIAGTNDLTEKLSKGSLRLRDKVEEISSRLIARGCLLLVVDQWEELYTLTKDSGRRDLFIRELLDASQHSKIKVVLTLSVDAWGKVLAHRKLSDRLQGTTITLGPMDREELQRAIEQPAREVGIKFEKGLTEHILDNVGDEPGKLALLEFVLSELWQKRSAGNMTHLAYQDMRGLHGAIAVKADTLFKEVSVPEQNVIRHTFLQLVHLSKDGMKSRRREELKAIPPSHLPLLEKLVKSRLLVINRNTALGKLTVEVAHEALIHNWRRLISWIQSEKDFLLWRDRLGVFRDVWMRGGKNEDLLLRGQIMSEAQQWSMDRSSLLTVNEKKFISASIAAEHTRERKARLQQEADLKRERMANKIFAGATVLTSLLVIVTTYLAIVAYNARKKEEEGRVASYSILARAMDRSLAASSSWADVEKTAWDIASLPVEASQVRENLLDIWYPKGQLPSPNGANHNSAGLRAVLGGERQGFPWSRFESLFNEALDGTRFDKAKLKLIIPLLEFVPCLGRSEAGLMVQKLLKLSSDGAHSAIWREEALSDFISALTPKLTHAAALELVSKLMTESLQDPAVLAAQADSIKALCLYIDETGAKLDAVAKELASLLVKDGPGFNRSKAAPTAFGSWSEAMTAPGRKKAAEIIVDHLDCTGRLDDGSIGWLENPNMLPALIGSINMLLSTTDDRFYPEIGQRAFQFGCEFLEHGMYEPEHVSRGFEDSVKSSLNKLLTLCVPISKKDLGIMPRHIDDGSMSLTYIVLDGAMNFVLMADARRELITQEELVMISAKISNMSIASKRAGCIALLEKLNALLTSHRPRRKQMICDTTCLRRHVRLWWALACLSQDCDKSLLATIRATMVRDMQAEGVWLRSDDLVVKVTLARSLEKILERISTVEHPSVTQGFSKLLMSRILSWSYEEMRLGAHLNSFPFARLGILVARHLPPSAIECRLWALYYCQAPDSPRRSDDLQISEEILRKTCLSLGSSKEENIRLNLSVMRWPIISRGLRNAALKAIEHSLGQRLFGDVMRAIELALGETADEENQHAIKPSLDQAGSELKRLETARSDMAK